jgi:hypothetical protein
VARTERTAFIPKYNIIEAFNIQHKYDDETKANTSQESIQNSKFQRREPLCDEEKCMRTLNNNNSIQFISNIIYLRVN